MGPSGLHGETMGEEGGAGNLSLCISLSAEGAHKLKGSEPEWTNPKSSTGNCMKCAKMQ